MDIMDISVAVIQVYVSHKLLCCYWQMIVKNELLTLPEHVSSFQVLVEFKFLNLNFLSRSFFALLYQYIQVGQAPVAHSPCLQQPSDHSSTDWDWMLAEDCLSLETQVLTTSFIAGNSLSPNIGNPFPWTVIVPVLRCTLITNSFCFLCLVVCVVVSNVICISSISFLRLSSHCTKSLHISPRIPNSGVSGPLYRRAISFYLFGNYSF